MKDQPVPSYRERFDSWTKALVQSIYMFVLVMAISSTGKFDHLTAENWPRHSIDDSLHGADGIRLADFDGDGLSDVVTGWEESGAVRLYRNPGPDQTTEPWPAVTIGEARSPEDAVPVDLDGDGKLEVVSCHEGKARSVWVHRHSHGDLLEPNRWSSRRWKLVDGQMWMFAVPLRLSNSRQALVIGSKGDNASISLLIPPTSNTEDLSAWTLQKLRDAGWIMSLRAIDMDNDGDEDLLFSDRKGTNRGVGWLEQPNQPNAKHWKEHPIGATQYEPMFVHASDQRVLVATRNSTLLDFRRIGSDQWKRSEIDNPPGVPYGKAVARLNRDTIVMTCNTNAVKSVSTKQPGTWIRKGDGVWQAIDPTPGVKLDRIECIDLDGDGDLDVMTCEERKNLGVIWYQNPG